MRLKQKITTFLWFDDDAEHAMKFYCSLFENSKILDVMRQGDKFVVGRFQLAGQEFLALNGGPHFKLSEAVSLYVDCETQAEVDELWEKLTADGGSPSQCGWLKDKFGLSWQIQPSALTERMNDPDPVKAKRVFDAMLKMQKIDVAAIEAAYEGR